MKTIKRVILSLLFLPLSVLAEDYKAEDFGMAQVVTFKENVTECLAAVQIRTIDGQLKTLPSLGFDIEPGWHTMHGMAKINLNHCPVKEERSREEQHIPALEWLFEAGKKYYVGLDHSSPFRKNWRLVVWQVEDIEG